MTTIEQRRANLVQEIEVREQENKAAKEKASAAGLKYEPVHAPAMIYKMKRDEQILKLLSFCGAQATVVGNEEMEAILARLTDPAIGTTVEVAEGDLLTELLFKRYPGVKDIVAKIEKACEEAGLKMDTEHNVIIKA